MIELIDVTQHYGVRPVLRGISARIERGEVVTILGPNGMGKSTLLGVMAGVLSPQRGTVWIDGLKRRGSEEEELAIRKMTVFLPDQPWLPPTQTGRQFLLAVGRLYDIEEDRLMEHADQLLDLFDLSKHAETQLWNLSAGQKKKVALCSALVTEAPILLLDEPFSGGLDSAGLLTLKQIIKHHTRRKDATIVLTSPVPKLVEEIATRIMVLEDGEILAVDTLDDMETLFAGIDLGADWEVALAAALAVSVIARGRGIGRALAGEDPEWGTTTTRPRLLTWLNSFIEAASATGALSRLRTLAEGMHEQLRLRWPTTVVPDYPALARPGATLAQLPGGHEA